MFLNFRSNRACHQDTLFPLHVRRGLSHLHVKVHEKPPKRLEDGGRLGRYEMRAPFAAWLARQAAGAVRSTPILESMRRYEVSLCHWLIFIMITNGTSHTTAAIAWPSILQDVICVKNVHIQLPALWETCSFLLRTLPNLAAGGVGAAAGRRAGAAACAPAGRP